MGSSGSSEGLGAEKVGVEFDEKKRIKVDKHFRTNIEGIYAIGDVIAGPMLAHKAEDEGVLVAEIIDGQKPHIDYNCIPSAVFSHPPLAGVGMTEAQARNKLGSIKVYTSDFRAMKNVLAGRNERALYKMICEAETGKIVGLHMIGPRPPKSFRRQLSR